MIVSSSDSPGKLYFIDPLQPPGAVFTVATNLGNNAKGLAFDGTHVWTANNGSVSIVTPGDTIPWTVTTVTAGFGNMFGPTVDGTNIWVTHNVGNTLLKLNSAGGILQTVTVGSGPFSPLYDGTNLWVPNSNDPSISVVRPGSGAILATLTGNGLSMPFSAAFDGQRILVTSLDSNNVSLWKAADLTPIGFFDIGGGSNRICSDGTNFYISSGSVVIRF